MNKKKVIGTIFIIIAFAIAIYAIVPKGENEKEETTNEETTVEESTSKIAITTTEEVPHETVTAVSYTHLILSLWQIIQRLWKRLKRKDAL